MNTVLVSHPFDDARGAEIRLLEQASLLGRVRLLLWSDALIESTLHRPAKFPLNERLYLARALRWVDDTSVVAANFPDAAIVGAHEVVCAEGAADVNLVEWCEKKGLSLHVIPAEVLQKYPLPPPCPVRPVSERKKVIVTGCFDWFHSGHVRFFEEVCELGDLYVVVGHDANIRLLKGEGHPLIGENERCFVAGSIKYAKAALVSTGDGWMDAAPQIELIQPDAYAVNEDGDKPEKRSFCEEHGLEYIVLKRSPAEGLARRSSTSLRGF